MKKLILLSGPYGVGKTTLANNLVNCLDKAIMFDGEWAWFQGNNWNFSKENKDMALDNICYILKSFLSNNQFETIIFSWVLHKQEDHDFIINYLKSNNLNFQLYDISLIAEEGVINKRLKQRICNKAIEYNAQFDDIEFEKAFNGSIKKLKQIIELNNIKIDVSNKTKEQVVNEILNIVDLKRKYDKIYIKH